MNRTYLKLNQDPRGWQPNESDEWMATIGKKEEEEEEEWNDGPSATSKSKKSVVLATSGLPVYRSLNQSAINWQAVPARLEGGPSIGGRLSLIHRFRFLRDRIFLSRRIFIFHRGKTHFSPPPRKRDPRLSPPLFFPQPVRRSIDSRSIRQVLLFLILFKTLFLTSFHLIWQSWVRKAWSQVKEISFLVSLFPLNLWRRCASCVP